jgi:predicted dehydrogenase
MKFGILGTGQVAGRFAAAIRASECVQAVAVASRDPDKARAFAAAHAIPTAHEGCEALLKDPAVGAVYIALPTHLHHIWAVRVAEAGKHILCEKPLAHDLGDAEAIVAAVSRHGVTLIEGYPWLHTDSARQLVCHLRAGAIGKPRFVQARMSYVRAPSPEDTAGLPAHGFGGGALSASGRYCLALAELVFARPPLRVFGVAEADGPFPDHTIAVTLDYGDRAMAQVFASHVLPPSDHATIVGSDRVIEFPIQNAPDQPFRIRRGALRGTPFADVPVRRDCGFRNEAETLARIARGLASEFPSMPLANSLSLACQMDAIRASVREGGWVALPRDDECFVPHDRGDDPMNHTVPAR